VAFVLHYVPVFVRRKKRPKNWFFLKKKKPSFKIPLGRQPPNAMLNANKKLKVIWMIYKIYILERNMQQNYHKPIEYDSKTEVLLDIYRSYKQA